MKPPGATASQAGLRPGRGPQLQICPAITDTAVNNEGRIHLEQTGLFGSYRTFELGSADKLQISSGDRLRHRDVTISVMALSPESRRRYEIAWPWLIATAAGIGFALLGAFAASLSSGLTQSLLWLSAGLSGAAAVVCLAVLAARSRAERVYATRHAGIPLVAMWANQPTRDEVNRFGEVLEARIERLSEKRNLDVSAQLAGEMRMLRRLHQEGHLSRDDYEGAKQTLLSRSDSVSMELSRSESLC